MQLPKNIDPKIIEILLSGQYCRPSFSAAPVEHYDGTPGYPQFKADENEIIIMGDMSLGVANPGPDGNIITAKTKELSEKLNKFESSGIFELGKAFLFNRRVNHFMFLTGTGNEITISFPNNRVFPTLYKKYAIRSIEHNDTYITAHYTPQGAIQSKVPMEIREYTFKDVVSNKTFKEHVSVGLPANATTTIVDKAFYLVDFFDTNDNLIETSVFQAIFAGKKQDIYSGQIQVKKIHVTTNRPANISASDENTVYTYLYEGESYNNISVYLSIELTDGTIIDVTNLKDKEWVINGLEEIKTASENITGENINSPALQEFKVVFNPQGNITIQGQTVNSIEKTVKVLVFADNRPTIKVIRPVVYDKTENGQFNILVKFYALYTNGETKDVTKLVLPEASIHTKFFDDFAYHGILNAYVSKPDFIAGYSSQIIKSQIYVVKVQNVNLKDYICKFLFDMNTPHEGSPASITYALITNNNITESNYNKYGSGSLTPSSDPVENFYDIHQMYTLDCAFNIDTKRKYSIKLRSDSIGKMGSEVVVTPFYNSIETYVTHKFKDSSLQNKKIYVSVRSGVEPSVLLVNATDLTTLLGNTDDYNNLGAVIHRKIKKSDYIYENAPLILEFYTNEGTEDNHVYQCFDTEIAYLKNLNAYR